MLYVFHVDQGHLATFDMQLSVAYVDKLKEEIQKQLAIPVDKQVLMMSGGHCLENHSRVCSFGTGTDTNPLYLFSRELAENPDPPKPIPDPTIDVDFKERIESVNNLPASYNTVVARAQLAQKFHEQSRVQYKACESLVLDQHRQQQGWAAVAAHLDDLVTEFRKRADAFLRVHQIQQEKIQGYKQQLQNFGSNLKLLSKIPVIPALLNNNKKQCEETTSRSSNVPMLTEVAHNEHIVAEEEQQSSATESSEEEEVSEKCQQPISLLQWVSMKDSRYTLEQMACDCAVLMEELSEQCIEQWKLEKDMTLKYIENYPLKEITGLSDRLCGLEQLMRDAERLVEEQADLSHALLQNQNRASNLGDPSILPDLCASHRRQLNVMFENHNHVRDIKRRCIKAKEELCVNLHKRLKWVLAGEKQLLECDYKLSAFTSKQKHLDYLLGVLDQIHRAPEMYLNAVIEVVRRRNFSQAFLTWASDLACQLTSIHSEEVMRRSEFQADFEDHFLTALFTGLHDMPPSYATEPPSLFDVSLPPLTLDDIELVKDQIPEIAEKLKIPDFSALMQFFQMKSVSGVKLEERGVGDDRCIEDRLVQAVAEAGLASAQDRELLRPADSQGSIISAHLIHHHIKDFDRGFESETDTEEFEKVGQSPVDLQFESKTSATMETGAVKSRTLDASTLTEVGGSASSFSRSSIPPKKPPRMFNRAVMRSVSDLTPPQPVIQELSRPTESSVTESTLDLSTKPSPEQSPVLTSSHQSHQMQSAEFVTAEYYIDESMPSSLSSSSLRLPVPAELMRQLDDSNSVVALLQDNLASTKTENLLLKETIRKFCELSRLESANCRTDLASMRTDLTSIQETFISQCLQIKETWEKSIAEANQRVREKIQRLTVDHELEMNDIKKLAITKDDEIRTLKLEKIETECAYTKRLNESKGKYNELELKLKDSLHRCEELEQQIEAERVHHDRALTQLAQEYQSEIESLRSRFRLMTVANMERSPSDSSLERIDRIDVIELVNHESIIAQLRENFVVEQEAAIKETIEKEQEKLEAILEKQQTEFEKEKQLWINDSIRRIKDEKDKQIEVLTSREEVLSRECRKYKDMIQQLAEGEEAAGSSSTSIEGSLLAKIDELQQDKCRLEAELAVVRSRQLFYPTTTMMTQSANPTISCTYSSTLPRNVTCSHTTPPRNMSCSHTATPSTMTCSRPESRSSPVMLTSSHIALIQAYGIDIKQCVAGQRALIVWNPNLQNYTVVVDSFTHFMLHTDCITRLKLPPLDQATIQEKVVGEVTKKELCYARKKENRYHLPVGLKFYRVRVKPLPRDVIAAVQRELGISSLSSSTNSVTNEATSVQAESIQHQPTSSGDQQRPPLYHRSISQMSQSESTGTPSPVIEDLAHQTLGVTTTTTSTTTSLCPLLTRSLFGVSSASLNSSLSIYHSLSQPSSLASCSGQQNDPPLDELDNTTQQM